MRIDYSEPKKSCGTPLPSQNRPRKESSGGVLAAVVISGLLCLGIGIGFGSGWMLSQRAAKKGFKAAMEQQSLENNPQLATVQPAAQPTAQQASQQPAAQPAAQGTAPAAPDPQLSFYKTLPSGQKNNALGSGINTKEGKPAKEPLQAAIPNNLSRPAAPQNDDTIQKQPAQNTPAKPAARQDSNGFTVQVASYSLKSEAETMRSKLATKGYNVSIIESHQGDKGTWYRVRIGKRLDQNAAKELAAKLGKGAMAIPDKE